MAWIPRPPLPRYTKPPHTAPVSPDLGRVFALAIILARPSSMLLLCICTTMTVGDRGYGRETWTRVLDDGAARYETQRCLGSRPICAIKRSSSPSDAKTKALGWLVRSRSIPRPPNLRQKAVLDRQTVHVSLAVAIALHRRAAMAVAGRGRRRLGHGTFADAAPLSSQSRNALPSGVICQPELSRKINL